MMNKKGDENTNEIVGVVVALLVILTVGGGIALGAVKYKSSTDAESARKLVDIIEAGISQYTGEGNGTIYLQGKEELAENNWFITAWSKNEEGRPDKCFFESCIMICPAKNICSKNMLTCDPYRKEDCQTNGFPADITKYEKIKIESFQTVQTSEFSGELGGVVGTTPGTTKIPVDYIRISNNLFKLNIQEMTEKDGTKYLSIS